MGITDFFTSLMEDDLTTYDLVVELAVGNTADDPNQLFVAKDGAGEIIDMSTKGLQAQKDEAGNSIKFVPLSYLADADKLQQQSANLGAQVIMENYGVYSQGNYARLPFDLENPVATPEMIPQIETALKNIRADLLSGYGYVEDGEGSYKVDIPDGQSVEKIEESVTRIEYALTHIENASHADEYKQQLVDGLKESNVPEDIQLGIQHNLDSVSNPAAASFSPVR